MVSRSFVIFVVLAVGSAAALSIDSQRLSPSDCNYLKEFLHLKNLTVPVPDSPVKGSGICGESTQEDTCCTSEMESLLKESVTKDLQSLLFHSYYTVHGVLASHSANLKEELKSMSEMSQNKTMTLFIEVYYSMWDLVKAPISELYSSLWSYLERGFRIPTQLPTSVPTEDVSHLEGIVDKFFKEMFPLVYHQAIHHLSDFDFKEEYKTCIKENMGAIMPFGSYPQAIADSVARSFEATKVLLEALSLGIEALSMTDKMMSCESESSEPCRAALLRLHYCPKCRGFPSRIKPCNGYCLNVMRGCLTQQRTTELDLPWSNFLAETQKLAMEIVNGDVLNIKDVLSGLGLSVSNAIMTATMQGPIIEKKVRAACGPPQLSEVEVLTAPKMSSSAAVTVSSEEDKEGKFKFNFELKSLSRAIDENKARGFYANLAESLCSDDSFAETRDTMDCWNGQRVGEYTKPLVRPGMDAQKYNPELRWAPSPPEPRVNELSEKLRHMRQVVASRHLSSQWRPESDSLVSTEGSGEGSGDDPYYSPGRDDEEGSGSGEVPPRFEDEEGRKVSSPAPPKVSGSDSLAVSILLLLSCTGFRWLL